jgi:secreted trypsin-like serine protease
VRLLRSGRHGRVEEDTTVSIRTTLAAAALAAAGLVAAAAPAQAITFGQPTGSAYSNVGSLVGTVDGVSYQWCTGTLIRPTVFLTASHCLAGFEGVDFSVTFAPVIDQDRNGEVDPGVPLIPAASTHTNPLSASGGANNTHDVAVVLLDATSPAYAAQHVASLPLATLPTVGLLDTRAARDADYVAVGYGTVRSAKQGGPHSFGVGWRREAAHQRINSVTRSWVTFSGNVSTGNGGTCYGDSGGPHFLGSTVVALTVTGDRYCRSTDKAYRLDTPDALAFLAPYLG